MSCNFKRTSVDTEEGQGASGKPDILENVAKRTKRKRSIKNNRGKRSTVPQILFPWVREDRDFSEKVGKKFQSCILQILHFLRSLV